MEERKPMKILQTENRFYRYLPTRDLRKEIDKADAKSRRDLRRGRPLLVNGPAPVFRPTYGADNSLVARTKAMIRRRCRTEPHKTHVIHLFKPRAKDKQCLRFNKAIMDLVYDYPNLVIDYVNPEDWGL